MKNDILEQIISDKQIEIANRKSVVSFADLIRELDSMECCKRSMSGYLANSTSGIIAEFKRRSPSKGWINRYADVATIAKGYEIEGASAISVLTDEKYFGGTLEDLKMARKLISIPILRKEFIVDEYQLIEAKIAGADAILLIAAALSEDECRSLSSLAHKLELEVLLELHSEQELGYINSNVDMVGINNRNLGTFHTDIDTSFRMFDLLPRELVKISESGIGSVEAIKELKKVGYQGFLVGEQFMRKNSPVEALGKFVRELELNN